MGDSTLHPHSSLSDTWPPAATPSGLTPNTRSEAEAALTLNSTTQTDSAAPTTPLMTRENIVFATGNSTHDFDEAKEAYRRPPGPIRTSSTNYEKALHEFRKQSSASTDMSNSSVPEGTEDITDAAKVDSPMATTVPFPPPGKGVVPLYTGVGTGQAEAVKKAKPNGLSLGALGRQQSWSEEDFKRLYTTKLMSKVDGDAGYDSSNEVQ